MSSIPARAPAPVASAVTRSPGGALRDPLLWVALGVQVALSLPGIATRSLWLDEAYTAIVARRSWGEIVTALTHDSGPPLHYWILSAWRRPFGESPQSLRAVSLLFALATCVALYRLAARAFDRETARTAALLWAASPMAVFYAGEARTYTLLAFLTVMLANAVIEPPAGWRWAPFLTTAATALALVYTHNMAWFAGAALLGAGVAVHGRRLLRPTLLAAGAVAVVGFLPWVPILRGQGGNIAWVRSIWSAWSPAFSLSGWAPWGWTEPYIALPSAPLWAWAAAVAAFYVPAGIGLSRIDHGQRPAVVFLSAFVGLGLLLPWGASLFLGPLSLPGRHDFFALPAVVVLVAVGLRRLRPWLGRAIAGALAAAGAASILALAARTPAMDDRLWTGPIAERGKPGDVVLCTGVTRPMAEYDLAPLGFRFLSYPRRMATDLAYLELAERLAPSELREDAAAVVQEATSSLQPGQQLWLVLSPPTELNEPLYMALGRSPAFRHAANLQGDRMGMRRLNQWTTLASFERTEER